MTKYKHPESDLRPPGGFRRAALRQEPRDHRRFTMTVVRMADPGLRAALLDILGPVPANAADLDRGKVGVEPRMLIAGALVRAASGAEFANVDPATGEVNGQVADA